MPGNRSSELPPGQAGAGDDEVAILPYDSSFEKDLVVICWETGLMGESLAGTGRFEDRRLFAMLFALPWVRFEPAVCRIAVAGSGAGRRAVGYIIGTTDARAMGKRFSQSWIPRIALRVLLLDWWLHPESARQVVRFLQASGSHGRTEVEGPGSLPEAKPRKAGLPSGEELGGRDFPAELHINLLPGWQGRGLGQRLMAAYLDALRERAVPGVFLETSSRNAKALPFYERLGFSLVAEEEAEPGKEFWIGLPARGLAYALRLGPAESSAPPSS